MSDRTAPKLLLRVWCLGALVSLLVACQPAAPPAQSTATLVAKPAATAAAKPVATEAPQAKPQAPSAASPVAASPVAAKPPAAAAPIDYAAVDAAVEAELGRLYEAAKTEGEVVLYATFALEDGNALKAAFEAKFPGVKLQHVRGDSSVLVPRFVTEVRAGRVLADLIRVTAFDMIGVHGERLLALYDSPARKAIPPELNQAEGYWSGDTVTQGVLAYNTSLVSPAEAPKTWDDLTDPKWKGKVISDPENGRFLMTLLKQKYPSEAAGLQVWKGIAGIVPEHHKGKLVNRDMLTSGQGAVCLVCYTHHLQQAKGQQAPVDWARGEALIEPTTIGLANGAPHPNAAKLFLTWYLGKGGQEVIGKVGRIPTRADVGGVGQTLLDPTTKRYIVRGEYAPEVAAYDRQFQEIFGLR